MASPSSMAALLLLLVVVAASAAEAAAGSTVVAGMVFCDQCKDGARGLFDYPLYGTISTPPPTSLLPWKL